MGSGLQAEPTLAVRAVRFHTPATPDVDAFLEDARAIVESGRLSSGPYVERLEQRLAPWAGTASVVAVSNCSDGLIAALSLLAEPGCEVIIPGFTYLATWQAVVWAGMVPVVADVDDNGLLDADAVDAAFSQRTGAIIAVHVTGALAPMYHLRALADRRGVILVADAAHALGSQPAEATNPWIGDAAVFSIGATKQVAAGEGGAISLRNERHVGPLRRWAAQGHAPGAMDALGAGMNLRLSELTAALAVRQLDGLTDQIDRRAEIHARYVAAFADLPVRLSGAPSGERSAFKDQLVWVDDVKDKAPLRARLAAAGVETRPYYDIAIPDLSAFSGVIASADRSRELAARSFAIPIHPRLSDDDVDHVIEAFRASYGSS
jgi:dTDP-4-amino-4,6-dideoxygalactose transaminase